MKKLAIIALAAFGASAFANGDSPEIVINGGSVQTVSAAFSAFTNYATNGNSQQGSDAAYALQNVSSNAGNVTINGGSEQHTFAVGSLVKNFANGKGAYAAQSISSNLGDVTVNGGSTQITGLFGSVVWNQADPGTKAVQNLASNNACVNCVPTSSRKH